MRNHTETDARILNVKKRYRYENPDSEINGAVLRVLLDRGRYCACQVDGKFFDRSRNNYSGASYGYLYKGFLTPLP